MRYSFPQFGFHRKIVLTVIAITVMGLTNLSPRSAQGGAAIYSVPVTNRVNMIFNTDWKYKQGDMTGAQAASFDDAAWVYVDLPHTTKFVTPDDPTAYLGVSWYRKHFTIDSVYQGCKVYIEFEAAMQAADVWINGLPVAHHEGGYTPFTIDATSAVTYGGADNVIAVRLDSSANPNWAPGKNGVDFQYHGGLYRDVHLYVTDKLHVTDAVYANIVAGGGIFVTYPSVSTSSAAVNILTNVINEYGDRQNAAVQSDIVDAAGNIVGTSSTTLSIDAGANTTVNQTITIANPHLWHPYTPNLYTLYTTIYNGSAPVDNYQTRIGIRTIAWSHDDGLLINGTRFKAMGVNYHQEIYGLGNAVPNQSINYDLKRIREAGITWIRASHYPHDPAFYDAADQLGILVMDAQTGWQNFSSAPAFVANTYQELRDMIRRDRNHPSIVAWEASLNESDYPDSWAQMANSIVHQEYPGDQAYSAQWKSTAADIFIGASQHGVRTSSDPRPIIISEYGDWDYGEVNSTSRQVREAGDSAMLTQANNIQDAMSRNWALSWFTADGYWDYADYGGFTPYGITRPGIVDMYRLPKFAYYFFQSQRDPDVTLSGIDSGPMVYIANQWTPDSPTTVRVYSNCAQVSLYLNDSLIATQAPDEGTHLLHPPFNFDIGSFTAGTLRADCLMSGVVQASFTRQTPGTAAAVRLRPEATTLQADMSDARLIFIDVVDANGTVVPSDSHAITLSISGPGSIVGPTTVTMKGGQLAAWVRSGRIGGTITLTASGSGLTPASVNLTSQSVPGLPPCPVDRCS
jgi:Glycosyl hydrolases family 2, TIM barrel domain/Glycoside hydrolase family 2 C-terminal domain 5/Glycosyl hydrolases family 2/Glycosyl hydrolases family 2, sugar binding domain/Domain of unknown function (DUF4982)